MIMEDKKNGIKVKKRLTLGFYMMVLAGLVISVGIIFFIIYFNTLNMVFGGPSIFMIMGGGILFYIYWGKREEGAVTAFIGGVKVDEANSMNIYPDMRVDFKWIHKPDGFPWEFINDGKMYFINKWNEESERFVPFILPDTQIMEPGEFAQRVLGLPAHRKLFTRKPKMMEKIKTALLVVAILIVWLLILTTT